MMSSIHRLYRCHVLGSVVRGPSSGTTLIPVRGPPTVSENITPVRYKQEVLSTEMLSYNSCFVMQAGQRSGE